MMVPDDEDNTANASTKENRRSTEAKTKLVNTPERLGIAFQDEEDQYFKSLFATPRRRQHNDVHIKTTNPSLLSPLQFSYLHNYGNEQSQKILISPYRSTSPITNSQQDYQEPALGKLHLDAPLQKILSSNAVETESSMSILSRRLSFSETASINNSQNFDQEELLFQSEKSTPQPLSIPQHTSASLPFPDNKNESLSIVEDRFFSDSDLDGLPNKSNPIVQSVNRYSPDDPNACGRKRTLTACSIDMSQDSLCVDKYTQSIELNRPTLYNKQFASTPYVDKNQYLIGNRSDDHSGILLLGSQNMDPFSSQNSFPPTSPDCEATFVPKMQMIDQEAILHSSIPGREDEINARDSIYHIQNFSNVNPSTTDVLFSQQKQPFRSSFITPERNLTSLPNNTVMDTVMVQSPIVSQFDERTMLSLENTPDIGPLTASHSSQFMGIDKEKMLPGPRIEQQRWDYLEGEDTRIRTAQFRTPNSSAISMVLRDNALDDVPLDFDESHTDVVRPKSSPHPPPVELDLFAIGRKSANSRLDAQKTPPIVKNKSTITMPILQPDIPHIDFDFSFPISLQVSRISRASKARQPNIRDEAKYLLRPISPENATPTSIARSASQWKRARNAAQTPVRSLSVATQANLRYEAPAITSRIPFEDMEKEPQTPIECLDTVSDSSITPFDTSIPLRRSSRTRSKNTDTSTPLSLPADLDNVLEESGSGQRKEEKLNAEAATQSNCSKRIYCPPVTSVIFANGETSKSPLEADSALQMQAVLTRVMVAEGKCYCANVGPNVNAVLHYHSPGISISNNHIIQEREILQEGFQRIPNSAAAQLIQQNILCTSITRGSHGKDQIQICNPHWQSSVPVRIFGNSLFPSTKIHEYPQYRRNNDASKQLLQNVNEEKCSPMSKHKDADLGDESGNESESSCSVSSVKESANGTTGIHATCYNENHPFGVHVHRAYRRGMSTKVRVYKNLEIFPFPSLKAATYNSLFEMEILDRKSAIIATQDIPGNKRRKVVDKLAIEEGRNWRSIEFTEGEFRSTRACEDEVLAAKLLQMEERGLNFSARSGQSHVFANRAMLSKLLKNICKNRFLFGGDLDPIAHTCPTQALWPNLRL